MAHEQIEKPIPVTQSGYTEEQELLLKKAVAEGIIKEIKPKARVSKLDQPIVQITGRPISETVVEDRI